jgi:CHAD domain-containing protein
MGVDSNRASARLASIALANLDCAAAFQKIALDAIGAIKANRARACAGDAEAVHQIRVAITRLRAAAIFFASVAADAEWMRLKREIAWLNDPLGNARDSDVVADIARRGKYRAWARAALGDQLVQRQARDHRRLARCLRSARARRLFAAMARWARQGAWLKRYRRRKDKQSLTSYCADQLDRWHARLVRKGKHLAKLKAERRHRLRILAKRFRYMIEALTETVPLWSRVKCREWHRPAKQLQRALGDMRDLERLAELAGGRRPPGYRRRCDKLLDAADAAYRDLERAKAR